MMGIGLLLLFLAIKKGFEPLLLVPIGFGAILVNIPGAGFSDAPLYDALDHLQTPGGLLYYVYEIGIATGIFPLIIFMGVGAMTDYGPPIANPKTLFLGAAAQVGIFATVLGAVGLSLAGIIDFTLADAAAISIIGGADGPTAIFVASKLAPELLGAIAVAAYSYMALVPMIQPPIMKALTTQAEREIVMTQLRPVSTAEKILFPLVILILVALSLPSAAPLLGILLLGMVAFCIGIAAGVLMGKLMNKLSKHPINPLIGAAGVSAVPMAARVANRVGLEANHHNYLLMYAMNPIPV